MDGKVCPIPIYFVVSGLSTVGHGRLKGLEQGPMKVCPISLTRFCVQARFLLNSFIKALG